MPKNPSTLAGRVICLKSENGFALIEIIVTTIIMIFVVLGSYAFQANMQRISNQNSAQYEMQNQANLALEYMAKYIRQANEPQNKASNPSTSCNYGGSYNDITISTPPPLCNSNSCINSGANAYYYRFWTYENSTSVSNGNLYMQQTKPSAPMQLLIGDYDDGRYGIKVLYLTCVNEAKNDTLHSNTALIKLNLCLGLKDMKSGEVVESMIFSRKVRPLNWAR